MNPFDPINMTGNCLICGCQQHDGPQPSMHTRNHILDTTSFATPDGLFLRRNAINYQPSLSFTSTSPTPSTVTQYIPDCSNWLTDEHTEPTAPKEPTYLYDILSNDNLAMEYLNLGCSQSEPLQTTSDDQYGRPSGSSMLSDSRHVWVLIGHNSKPVHYLTLPFPVN